MKKWHWVILGIVTYFIFLVVYMPAQYVTAYAQDNSNNKIRFTGVSGTLLSGSANSVSFEGLQVDNVNWELSPFSLLLLKANVDIKGGAIRNAEKIYVNGTVNVSLINPHAINVSNAQILAPAKPLLAQVNLPVVVTALGRFRLDIDNFEFNQGCEQLQGKGSWLKAALNIEGKPLVLNSFEAALSCDTPSFAMQVAPDNVISLDAKITFNQTGKYSANGTYSIPSNFPNDIKQAASFFGKSLGQNRYELNIESR